MNIENEKAKKTGLAAAYNSGKILMKYYGKLKEVNKKGKIDLLTIADLESEKKIVEIIKKSFPDHNILAEESGSLETDSPFRWIIDPLDGTTNYAHYLPLFCTSIALAYEDEILLGIVLNPAMEELFIAVKNHGAFLNGKPIKVSKSKELNDSILVTGFPYDLHEHIDQLISRFKQLLETAQAIRRFGSAAIDLCYVACGRFDGFWEQNLKPWDTAAGILIVEEAGGKVTNFSNKTFTIDQKEILATNGNIHEQVLKLL